MTQDNLPRLLDKYREGTISDAELAELNRLTHRDEVLASANRRAGTILFRRYAGRTDLAVAALLLLGAGVWALRPHHDDSPLVAEAQLPAAAPLAAPQPAAPPAAAPLASQPPATAPKTSRKAARQAQPKHAPAVVTKQLQLIDDQPVESVVTCNNKCEADSVISDIWKFLSA